MQFCFDMPGCRIDSWVRLSRLKVALGNTTSPAVSSDTYS